MSHVAASAHHADHHAHFICNYGQFTTLWDRLGNSFRTPTAFGNVDGPAQDSLASKRQAVPSASAAARSAAPHANGVKRAA